MLSANIVSVLLRGGLVVIPTDTLSGVVASARNQKAVARLYRLRRKAKGKPFIILVSSVSELADFGVTLSAFEKEMLKEVWPGKISGVFPCPHRKFSYLHLGTQSLAFRFPRTPKLIALLKKTGPLLAPSANPEGKPPATTLAEAKSYFGSAVDFYVNAGKKKAGKPSTLISFQNGQVQILREGAVAVKKQRKRRHPHKQVTSPSISL